MKENQRQSIGWINGKWGALKQLNVPITDRGLILGDGIFETILIYRGKIQLLENHLNRWQQNASILNMEKPPTEKWLKPLIDEAIQRSSLHKSNGVLRLNWTRGDNSSRGINIHKEVGEKLNHRFWLEVYSAEPCFDTVSTIISRIERRNAHSQLSQCKTFAYGQSIQARYEAKDSGYDDALLLSTNGELCCATTANLLIKRQGQWITPRLETGCLPGIMRQQGLDSGLLKEAKINDQPYQGDEWLLINSLGCRAIKQCNDFSIQISSNPKEIWLSLLDNAS